MTRFFGIVLLLLSVAACERIEDLDQVPQPMGRFLLGHNIVVVNEPDIGPLSRTASDEEWKVSVETAITERFSRYDGDAFFHVAVKVEGYVLAGPGIPLVLSPKSVVFVSVTIWDDTLGVKLNEEPKVFTVFERLSGETLIGSGLTQSKEQQMENLSRNAAKAIHMWMLENIEWFGDATLMDPEMTSQGWARPAAEIIEEVNDEIEVQVLEEMAEAVEVAEE